MRDQYEIETLEQLRAIADILRVRIINLLTRYPMTVTQLGEEMSLPPARIHYHVRELEKVGLLEMVETREKGGILEKYYQPVAREIRASQALLTVPLDEAQAALQALLGQISSESIRAFRYLNNQKGSLEDGGMSISLSHLYLTPGELHTLLSQLAELSKLYETRRGIEGEQEIAFSLLTYPASLPADTPAPVPQETARQISRVWVVGTLVYRREDLFAVLAEGKRLHISVIGMCHFASDIEASLVEEVVEAFSIVGKLSASDEVKAVLKRKEEQKRNG